MEWLGDWGHLVKRPRTIYFTQLRDCPIAQQLPGLSGPSASFSFISFSILSLSCIFLQVFFFGAFLLSVLRGMKDGHHKNVESTKEQS